MTPVIQLKNDEVAARLDWDILISAIERTVRVAASPPRQNHALGGGVDGRLLIMPAWQGADLGVKIVTYRRDNFSHGLPTHGASYLLLDAHSGGVKAIFEAETMTHWRTAAVSALAASRLLPQAARRLLVIGTGPIGDHLVLAHAASGRFDSIEIFGRSPAKADAMVGRLTSQGQQVRVSHDLEESVRAADMIVSATSAKTPFLMGEWLKPDAHVDLIGSFAPDMREADDKLIMRAAEIWMDAPNAVIESGELCEPIKTGVITPDRVTGDLAALMARPSRTTGGITLFKSIGLAAADLATAQLLLG